MFYIYLQLLTNDIVMVQEFDWPICDYACLLNTEHDKWIFCIRKKFQLFLQSIMQYTLHYAKIDFDQHKCSILSNTNSGNMYECNFDFKSIISLSNFRF